METPSKGLIFLPDISGFTRFVNEMEIEHSRLIIQELLETIINSNHIGLEVSEIEGDAVLFYRFGQSPPDLKELYTQVEEMFREFQRCLIAYDHRRFCQCKACMTAINLTLKIITHYGEFTGYNVHNYNKLIGKDVIVAHQLLKNDIPQHEYWLVTENLLSDDLPAGYAEWMKWLSSSKQTENGTISFYYTQLGPLKNGITPEPLPKSELSDKIKILSVTREYDTDIITLFHATGDFNYRSSWQEGVKKVEEVDHILPRVGMRCKREMEDGGSVIYTTSYSYTPGLIEFSETDEKMENAVYYKLELLTDNKTKLTIDLYTSPAQSINVELLKKKLESEYSKSLQNLAELVKGINYRVKS